MNAPQLQLPIFGAELASCSDCELKPRKEQGLCVPSRPPTEPFNGLMIVGEGPGRVEVLKARPFVGPAGNLLDALLEAAEISRDATFVTNATLCQPPLIKDKDDKKTGFHGRFPNAVPSCLPRLEAEIAFYKPRVIVVMGTPALIASIGFTREKARQVDNPCATCENKRKRGPAIQCAVGECHWTHFFDAPTFADAEPLREQLLDELGRDVERKARPQCPKCGAKIDRLKIRDVPCPDCGGKKKKIEKYLEWDYEYTIKETAGAIFEASALSGEWHKHGVKYVIPTFHPAFCLRDIDEGQTRKAFGGQYAAQAVADHLTKARKLLVRDYSFRFRTTITDRAEDVRAYTAEPGLYTVDLETNAKSPWDVTELRNIGIGRADCEEVLVVDGTKLIENAGTDERHEFQVLDDDLLGALEDFLTADGKPKIAQNGAEYDWVVLWRLLGIEVTPIGGDTKQLHHVLRPDEPHDLGSIAAEMTEAPHWKPPKTEKGGFPVFESFTDLSVYNARDVRTTALSHEACAGFYEPATRDLPLGLSIRTFTRAGRLELPDLKLRDVYDLDVAVLPIALEMERYGLPLDLPKMRALEEERRPKYEALRQELIQMTGLPGFNPDSTPQLQFVLFHPTGPFKLTATARTETGQPSTAKDELAKLADHPFVRALLDARELKACLNVLGGSEMIVREDGAVHPSWNTAGARTGRWSSSPNFQNIPEWLRAIVKAPPGWVVIGADESQLELRNMAALSGDANLTRRCIEADENQKANPDKDPHAFVASVVFGEAFSETDEAGRAVLRGICKHVIYGMNYGAGPDKVRETIYKKGYKGPRLEVQQIKRIIEIIFEVFPGVPIWRDKTLAWSEREQQVRSPLLGRWRYFPLGKVEATVAWNYPIQSLAADLLNIMIVALKQELVRRHLRHRFMAQVHDALYLLAPEEHAQAVADVMAEKLSARIQLVEDAPEMIYVATPHIHQNWSMGKE